MQYSKRADGNLLKIKLRGRTERKKKRKRKRFVAAIIEDLAIVARTRGLADGERKSKNYRPIIYYVICVARYTERK